MIKNPSKNNSKSRFSTLNEESGAIILFIAISLAVIVGVAALSVDQNRAFLSHREAENLADAVALAAAKGLDGTRDGWIQSGNLATFILRESQIQGVSASTLANVSGFTGNSLIVDNITIELERGFYNFPGVAIKAIGSATATNDDTEWAFIPLPDIDYIGTDSLHLPAHFLANAVRARVIINDLKTPFKSALDSLLGHSATQTSQDNIVGQAIATSHEELEQPIFPIAIPACELLTDLDPYKEARFDTNTFSTLNSAFPTGIGQNQCGREIVAREPRAFQHPYDMWEGGNLDDPTATSFDNAQYRQRVDGNLRSDSYPRLPMFNFTGIGANVCYRTKPDGTTATGFHPNCKAFPINAILGVPNVDSFSGIDSAITAELVTVLNATTVDPIRRAKIGSRFAAMNGPGYLDNKGFQLALEGIFNSASPDLKTIEESFYDNPTDLKTGMKQNFPHRRNLRFGLGQYSDPLVELRDMFVTTDPADPTKDIQLGILMGNTADYLQAGLDPSIAAKLNTSTDPNYVQSNPLDGGNGMPRYTNPMCHDESIPFDSKDAPVVEGYAMLIASDGGSYCDLNATMSSAAGGGTTANLENPLFPSKDTDPRVVGFVKVNLFDFRVKKYSDAANNSATPPVLWLNQANGDLPPRESGNDMADINDWSLDLDYLPEYANLLNQANVFGQQNSINAACDFCATKAPGDSNCLAGAADFDISNCTHYDPNYVENSAATQQSLASDINNLTAGGLPNWMIDCFADLGVGLEEAGEQLETPEDTSCYEVCGGVYLPTTLARIPNTALERQRGLNHGIDFQAIEDAHSGSDVAIYKLLPQETFASRLSRGAQEVDAGDGYSWVGHDPDCVAGLQTGGTRNTNCSTATGAAAVKPKGSFDCEYICKDSQKREDTLFSGNWRDWSGDCQTHCNNASGVTNTLPDAFATQQNSVENLLEPFDLSTPPPVPTDADTQAILRAVENAEENSGATQVCLPRRKTGYYDVLSSNTWEDPQPRDAGWGCAGVRLRMSCEQTSHQFGIPLDELKPRLVGK